MSLRLMHITLQRRHVDELNSMLADIEANRIWHTELDDDRDLTTVLLRADAVEDLADKIAEKFESIDRFRLVLVAAEATRPALPEPPKAEVTPAEDEADEEAPKQKPRLMPRVAREELYEKVAAGGKPDALFFFMTALATIVAAVGLLRDSPAIIIGAMVIAPLLGPNMALALATTLGDTKLIKRGLTCASTGAALAIALSAGIGVALGVAPDDAPEIASRTSIRVSDIALAIASGAAGAIALTTGAPAALVGVMVAVALLPPTVTAGLLLGGGHPMEALGSLGLVLVNVASVNLAATFVFLSQGVRPDQWWKQGKAKQAARRAILIWAGILAAIVTIIIFSPSASKSSTEPGEPPAEIDQ
ncbi:MAG: TIGR00341 family protein [Planctomycetota bacterium]